MFKIKLNNFSEYFVSFRWVVLVMIGFSIEIQAQVPSYVPSNGLVAWYPFNGNANDESGNGNNGSIGNGVAAVNDRFNSNNSALYFNGSLLSNSGVEIPNSTLLNIGIGFNKQFTISLWYKNDSLLGSGLLGKSGSIITKPRFGNSTVVDYSLFLEGSDLLWGSGYSVIAGGDVCSWKDILAPPKSSWQHVVVTLNQNINSSSGTKKIYLNGLMVDSCQYNFKNNSNSNPLCIGVNGYVGSIDDIGFWNRELSNQEVSALYNACNSLPTVAILPLSSTIICQGDSVELMSSVQGAYNYKWFRNNTILNNEITSKYTAKENGSYSLEIDSSGCSSKSLELIVKVSPRPIVQCAIAPFINIAQIKVPIIGTPVGGDFSGNGVLGNVFEPFLAGFGKKGILYTYTDSNNCSNMAMASTIVYDTIVCSTSVTDTLIINTTISTLTPPNNLNTIKIYPNPASTHITIDYGNYQSMIGFTLKIVNTLGATFYTAPINKQLSYIDLSTWSGNGLYFVQILDSQNNIVHNKKILIQ
jgi:hypothetical protein